VFVPVALQWRICAHRHCQSRSNSPFIYALFLYIGAGAVWHRCEPSIMCCPTLSKAFWPWPRRIAGGAALGLAGASLVSVLSQRNQPVTLIYGSLSGFIATLIFFYVMLPDFIYGAEFNHELMVLSRQGGLKSAKWIADGAS
jgi:hypothetical protein